MDSIRIYISDNIIFYHAKTEFAQKTKVESLNYSQSFLLIVMYQTHILS